MLHFARFVDGIAAENQFCCRANSASPVETLHSAALVNTLCFAYVLVCLMHALEYMIY